MTRRLLLTTGFILVLVGAMLFPVTSAQDDDEGEAPEATTEVTEEAPQATEEAVTDDAMNDETLPTGADLLDSDVEVAIEPTGNNGYCTICHNQPLRTLRLEDGSILNLFVNPEMIVGSVHGPSETSPGLGCLDCHEDSFPHNEPTPTNGRVYTIEMVSLCTSCHVEQAENLSMGLHTQAIEMGNLEAAVCTDCHDAHHVQSAENFPDLVAGVCGDCHDDTFDQWIASDHAEIGPLGCAACHDHHAQTLRIGETANDLCINCHDTEAMPDIFAHETHIEVDNPVGCVECHMFSDDMPDAQTISIQDNDFSNHSMMLDTTPCTTCHENLVSTGEWQNIVAERYSVPTENIVPEAEVEGEEAGGMTETVTEAVDEEDVEDDADTLSTIQGLLVGLGLGLTLAIVFVTRTQRAS